MKKITLSVICLMLLTFLVASPVFGAAHTSITISWTEDAIRYHPDGTYWTGWTGDPNGPMELLWKGNSFHVVDIAEFYNTALPDVQGTLTLSGAGNLSGHATYISLVSGLPIKELIKGDIVIDFNTGTFIGSYTQKAYAFGSQEDITAYYPNSAPEKSNKSRGWWFIGYTEYTVYDGIVW